jgi:hypothetical protein
MCQVEAVFPAPLPWLWTTSVVAFLGACTAATATNHSVDRKLDDACFRLLQSPPHLWPSTFDAVVALGPKASVELASALRRAPHAPGAQAAAAALGTMGERACTDDLVVVMGLAPEPVAAEAALSLGRLGAVERVVDLRDAMHDQKRTPLVRTAAAAAVLACEHDLDAIAFLCDLILAATPSGRQRGLELGLPVDRPRWALERNLAIATLGRVATVDLGLDADAPWPRLASGVEAARRHFGLVPR